MMMITIAWAGKMILEATHLTKVILSDLLSRRQLNLLHPTLSFLDSGRVVPFATDAGFGVADWNQVAWLDTSKILQNSGVSRRGEIGDDIDGNPVQGESRRLISDYGYDANDDLLSGSTKDDTTGFQNCHL